MVRWHFCTRRYVPRALLARMRADCSALVLSNVQTHAVVPVPPRGAAAGASDRRPRRELGPHGRKGGDRAVLRRLRRPERGHAGRPRPLPRHRPRARRRHRLAADGRLPRDGASRDDYEALLRGLRPRSGAAARARHGQHADERAVRGAIRRADRRVVGGRGARPLLAPLPPASARPRVARALRVARCSADGVARPGRRASPTSTSLATLLQHADCVVPNAGTILLDALVNDRPAGLRALRRGRAAGGELGGQERDRRALPRADGVERLLPRRRASRRSSTGSSGRSPTRRSCATSDSGSRTTSSARSTVVRPSGSSTRSSR